MRLATTKIVYREDLYPRFKPNPSLIQTYAENLDQLPPVEVNQHNELIDGYHRWKAHETAGEDEVEVTVTRTKSDAAMLQLAIERNAKHGQQLTAKEKKALANRLFGQMACQSGHRTDCDTMLQPD